MTVELIAVDKRTRVVHARAAGLNRPRPTFLCQVDMLFRDRAGTTGEHFPQTLAAQHPSCFGIQRNGLLAYIRGFSRRWT